MQIVLKKSLRMIQKMNSGFTLIEMMVAVMVVSIMISIMIPHLIAAGTRAAATASTQNQQTIRAAIEEYYLIHNKMPEGNSQEQLKKLVAERLLESIPENPAGTTYLIDDSDVNNVIITHSNEANGNA